MSKFFSINAGVKLPHDFIGGHEEALSYLLYEVLKQEHATEKAKPRQHENTLVWLHENNQTLWYQVSLLDEGYLTEQDQDEEDAEIDAILQASLDFSNEE
jgi:hypothetical protein